MLFAIPFPPLSPELFSIQIGGFNFALRWYALAYILGILIGWRLGVALVKRAALWPDNKPPFTPEQVEALMTWLILGIVLGGRLGFVLFYQPDYYLRNPAEIFMLWQGGMSFHGGLLGVIVAALTFCLLNKVPLLKAADIVAVCVPPGLMLGRLANFVNAELWGRATTQPWGVIFPGPSAQDCPIDWVGVCARHPSQLYEAVLEGLLLGSILLWAAYRRGALKRSGFIAGLFFAGYGLARYWVEMVRQPDAQFVAPGNPLGYAWQFSAGGDGLTMGQILSLPMIAVGIALMLNAQLRKR